MVEPPFRLAQESPGVRRYIKAFSLELALEEGSALSLVSRHGGGGGNRVGSSAKGSAPPYRISMNFVSASAWKWR